MLIEQLMKEILELRDKIQELTDQNNANLELLDNLRIQLEMVYNLLSST